MGVISAELCGLSVSVLRRCAPITASALQRHRTRYAVPDTLYPPVTPYPLPFTRFSTFPGRAFVNAPLSITGVPFTITYGIPTG